MPPSSNYVAFTAPINPPSTQPHLTRPQIWACLLRKIKAGQDFVGGAILSTTVLEEYSDGDTGAPVVVREVVFREGNRKVKETCIACEPTKVDFLQPDGSRIQNVVSEDAEGALWMTYVFEWRHPGMEGREEELKEARGKEEKMARVAVESTIVAMREMVRDGRVQG